METDTRTRSLAKAISYRSLMIASDAFVVFFITHRYDLTFWVVLATNAASTLLYFLHERGWSLVRWGRARNGHEPS